MIKTLFAVAVVTAFSITAFVEPAGAKPKPFAGGTNQRSSVEGCIGQTLFDGFWRFKVTRITTAEEPGYTNIPVLAVSMEIRNARSLDSTPALLGVQQPQVVLDNGTVLDLSTGSEISYSRQMQYANLAPGASARTTSYFRTESNTGKPAKLLLAVTAVNQVFKTSFGYPTANPSFRVHLNCTR